MTPPADFVAAREEVRPDVRRPEPMAQDSSSGGVGVVNVNVHATHPPSPPISAPAPLLPAPAPVTPTVDPNAELLAKYKEAQAEIQRLRSLLAAVPDPSSVASSGTTPTELRRRHRPRSDDGTTVLSSDGTYTEDSIMQQDGVPLQVVVIIALLIFIMTYLFF